MRNAVAMAGMAAGGLLLAACGGATRAAHPAGSSGAMPGMSMPSAKGTPAPVAGNAVAIRSFAFAPATLAVRAGTTVTWTNDDEEPHTVTATGGPFRSATLPTGKTFRYTFAKPGRYPYICTIHPFMRGTVVVTG